MHVMQCTHCLGLTEWLIVAVQWVVIATTRTLNLFLQEPICSCNEINILLVTMDGSGLPVETLSPYKLLSNVRLRFDRVARGHIIIGYCIYDCPKYSHQSGLEAIQTSENLGLSLLLNVEAMNARILSGIPRGIEHIYIRKSLLYALTVSPSSSVCTVAHMLTI